MFEYFNNQIQIVQFFQTTIYPPLTNPYIQIYTMTHTPITILLAVETILLPPKKGGEREDRVACNFCAVRNMRTIENTTGKVFNT
jgi:hypothetical protein